MATVVNSSSLSPDLIARLDAALLSCLLPHSKIYLAYSGGVDSELLATALGQSQFRDRYPITLLHVHHGLSANAEQWVKHCQQQAKQAHFALEVIRVQLQTGPRQSIEAVARDARYQAFSHRLMADDVLLTGHHQDDQVETLLLALKRGSGPQGLSAMAARQPFALGQLIRPWLGVSRALIEAEATRIGLTHIHDESNDSIRFDRNFLRHQVLPQLNQRWPGFNVSAVRSAELCAQQQSLCDELAVQDLAQYGCTNKGLLSQPLAHLSEARRNNLLRYWLKEQSVLMPSRAQLQAMSQLWSAKIDATPQVYLQGGSVRRYQNVLYWIAEQPVLPQHEIIQTKGKIRLANGEYWSWQQSSSGERMKTPETNQIVRIHYGLASSTRVQPASRCGSRALKKVWQEYQIPPWQRSQIPMLFYNQQFVAALGVWIEKNFLCQQGQGLVAEKLKPESA